MFWWLMNSKALRLRQTLIMTSRPFVRGPSIQSQLSRFHPIEYATADNSYIYMATGLNPVTKWDGLLPSVVEAGVPSPTAALTLSFSGTGGDITGDYQAYQRWLDVDGNVSNLSLPTPIVTATGATTAQYTSVQAPTDARVVRRQILRNVAGSFLVFYVDVDTTDMFATSFSSTNDNDDLRLLTAVAIFDETLTYNIANFHGVPPNDKPLIAFYQNRLWLYGNISYDIGMVQVATNSTTVTGVGTRFTSAMVGRVIYLEDADRYYNIDEVDEAAQTLTIDVPYRGETSKFAAYTIQSTPDRRHLLAFSEAGQPDSWRATQNIVISSSDDMDDDGTALISTQSFLYLVQRRHIYRLTFFEDPTLDGGVFLSARRGCINNRCWLTIDGFVYMLDDRGIYRFDGGDATDELSAPIQDIFYFDRPPSELRLNWSSNRWWHAHHDRNDSTMRWFVGLSGQRYPRHALCFNYVNPQWWIEEYPWPIIDSTQLKTVNPIPITASKYHKVFAVGIGTLDDVSGSGDTFGAASSGGVYSITAPTSMTLPASLAGTPIAITSGRGKGQLGVIASVNGRVLTVTHPWSVKPNATSKFRIGGIAWKWKSPWIRWNPGEMQQSRRIAASFDPSTANTSMDLRLYEDYAKSPVNNELTWPINPSGSSGITTTDNDPDSVVDMSLPRGYAHLTIDDLRERNEWRRDVISIELRGFSSDSAVRIYQIDVEGAGEGRKRG